MHFVSYLRYQILLAYKHGKRKTYSGRDSDHEIDDNEIKALFQCVYLDKFDDLYLHLIEHRKQPGLFYFVFLLFFSTNATHTMLFPNR